jgi:hypothetical protein
MFQMKGITMRLTKTIRESFVRAAMNDVPQTDYNEQITKLAKQEAEAMMPPEVAKAYKLHPDWFPTVGHYIGYQAGYVYIPLPSGLTMADKSKAKLLALAGDKVAQEKDRNALSAKLQAAADSVTTRKALVALLPEFEKYLPADDEAACKTLPAVANLLADFSKAGWPKSATAKTAKSTK